MSASRHSRPARRPARPRRSIEHQVRLLARAVIALLVCVVLLAAAVVYLLVGRADARRYYNHLIHQLVCEVPPGSPIGDQLRAENHCGTYQRPNNAPTTPARSPAPQAARPLLPDAAPEPAPPTRTAPARSRRPPTPPASRSTARSAPRPTATRSTASTSHPPSSPPTVPATPALSSVLCGLLHHLQIGICA